MCNKNITNIINNFVITELTPETIGSVPSSEIYLMELIEPSSFGLVPLPVDAYDAEGNVSPAWFSYGAYRRAIRIEMRLDIAPRLILKQKPIKGQYRPIKQNNQKGWRGYFGE